MCRRYDAGTTRPSGDFICCNCGYWNDVKVGDKFATWTCQRCFRNMNGGFHVSTEHIWRGGDTDGSYPKQTNQSKKAKTRRKAPKARLGV